METGAKPRKVDSMAEINCGMCFFFDSFGGHTTKGICRRNPPASVNDDGAVWPVVKRAEIYKNHKGKIVEDEPGDWCGQYVEAKK